MGATEHDPAAPVPNITDFGLAAAPRDDTQPLNGAGSPEAQKPHSDEWRDRRFARAMWENTEWVRAHEQEILRDHPDWEDKYVAVAICTPSKILAVSDDRQAAFEESLRSPELLEQARREGVAPGSLVSLLILGWRWLFPGP